MKSSAVSQHGHRPPIPCTASTVRYCDGLHHRRTAACSSSAMHVCLRGDCARGRRAAAARSTPRQHHAPGRGKSADNSLADCCSIRPKHRGYSASAHDYRSLHARSITLGRNQGGTAPQPSPAMLPANAATPRIACRCQRHDSARVVQRDCRLAAVMERLIGRLISGHGKALRGRLA
jgi:hypothetical protein